MRTILLLFLIGLSLSYNPGAAVSYARKYCSSYNRAYENYASMGGDCANFVSQCMIAGGFSFKGCSGWVDSHGCMPRVTEQKNCLKSRGWKEYTSRPNCFKAGYPFFFGDSHAVLASYVSGNTVKYCGHTNDRCDYTLSGSVLYYCP